jgi:hypothetical protein
VPLRGWFSVPTPSLSYIGEKRVAPAGGCRRRRPNERGRQAAATDIIDPVAIAAAHSMLGVSHHLIGNLAAARDALAGSARQPADPRRVTTKFFGADRDAPVLIPRTLWQMGFPDQTGEAAHIEHPDPVTAWVALIGSASIFHLMGEWETVED